LAVAEHRLPVRPDLDQLTHEAKALLREMQATEPAATLADAQQVLARRYQAHSWTRLVQAVQLANAIWDDDLDTVRALVTGNPHLLHEPVLVRTNSNWGPPLTYAANLGRDGIIRMLHGLGATDLATAFDRAALAARTRRRSQRAGTDLEAAASRPRRPGPARLSRRHRTVVGTAFPRPDFRERAGHAVD
jgi:hypothetical protein